MGKVAVERIEGASLDAVPGFGIALAARRFQPDHTADGLAAMDRSLCAAQDLDPAEIVEPRTGEKVSRGRGRVAKPDAIDHELRVGGCRPADEHGADRPGLAGGGGGGHAGHLVERLPEVEHAAIFQLARIQQSDCGCRSRSLARHTQGGDDELIEFLRRLSGNPAERECRGQ